MIEPPLHALVLAAGRGERFGSLKQQVEIAGKPMLEHVLQMAAGVLGPSRVTVVLGHEWDVLRRLVERQGAHAVENTAHREGIGSSIRAGVSALPGTTQGVLILLADQVAVTGSDLATLIATWRMHPDRRVAAAYAGSCGVPAIFPAADFPRLAQLGGDRGARALLNDQRGETMAVPMPAAAIDIDTVAELEAFRTGMPITR